MIRLLEKFNITKLDKVSPTASRIHVRFGVSCKNCGRTIAPFALNGVGGTWIHLHIGFRWGAGNFCDDEKGRAEPLIQNDIAIEHPNEL